MSSNSFFAALRGFAALGVAAAFGLGASSANAALPIQHWTQPSGAQIYLVESPAIPMVDVELDFDGGSRRDPVTKVGLASVSAAMSGRGLKAAAGEPALDENALSEAWADLGASFGGRAGNDRLSFGLRSLTEVDLLSKAARLVARQLAEPSLPEDIWLRERERLTAALREADTRPATQASKNFERLVYGDHPYGREMTAQTLANIGIGDMQRFLSRSLKACAAQVTIVGALDRSKADTLASQMLSRLPQTGCEPLPAVAEVKPLQQASQFDLPFDSAQAHVLMGQPGIARSDPDYFPLLVGNYILGGGGFVSRLTSEVREKRGLSYSIYSYFAPSLHAGAFMVGLQTRPDQVAQALKVSREVVAQFVAQGPTEAELQAAKDNLVGGFALRIDTNQKLLDNVANMAWNHLPMDYLDTWTQQVEKLTVADIRAAFQRHLLPDRMVTVTVGAKP
jgi:zinc protease